MLSTEEICREINKGENMTNNIMFFSRKRSFGNNFKAKDLLLIENKDFILELPSISSISDDDAKYLSQIKCYGLVLNGLNFITEKQAKYLSSFNGQRLGLGGLTRTSTEALKNLINYEGNKIEIGFSHDIKKEDLALLKKFQDNNQTCVINFGKYPLGISEQMLRYVKDNIKFCEDNGLFLKGTGLSHIDIIFEDKEAREKLKDLIGETNVSIEYHLDV